MTLPTPVYCKRTIWDTCEATGAHQQTNKHSGCPKKGICYWWSARHAHAKAEHTNRWATPCRCRVPCPMPNVVVCAFGFSVFVGLSDVHAASIVFHNASLVVHEFSCWPISQWLLCVRSHPPPNAFFTALHFRHCCFLMILPMNFVCSHNVDGSLQPTVPIQEACIEQ